MADEVRITQDVVEVISERIVEINVTQNVIEVAHPVTIPIHQTQQAVEVAHHLTIPILVTQNVVEIIMGRTPLTGLYFLNKTKNPPHDVYNTEERKIPDPTIKTAYFGE